MLRRLLPIVVLVVYSFNAGPNIAIWEGFSLRWYDRLIRHDTFRDALVRTVYVSTVCALIALPGLAVAVLIDEAEVPRPGDPAAGLRVAVDAGCDLIQHCNKTGPVPIPEQTLEIMAQRKVGAVVFPHTERGIDWLLENLPENQHRTWQTSDINVRNLIRAGATLLMANDGNHASTFVLSAGSAMREATSRDLFSPTLVVLGALAWHLMPVAPRAGTAAIV